MTPRGFTSALTLVATCLGAPAALAQGIATDRLIDSITVTADRDHDTLSVPNTVATKSQEDLRSQNLVNPEDALNYLPNLTIRKRYIGDRNALIGGRSFSTLQAARGLVMVDGYLLSNFLGRFDAPRWNMVSPEEIERVDAIYGPFSALYPGNSIGTTIAIRTRKPEAFEVGVRSTAFAEQFSEYGVEDTFHGYQASAFIGDVLSNGVWFSVSANHQDATSHPMQYFTITADGRGNFPALSGEPTDVKGVRFDTDPRGRRRAVFGANSGAIDTTEQTQFKLRGGYALRSWLELDGFIALWQNDSRTSNQTFMRDEQGNEVWSGLVRAGDTLFEIPQNIWSAGERLEEHSLWGLTARTTRAAGWNGSIVYSQYAIEKDTFKQALSSDPIASFGGSGTDTRRDGTGWRTFEAQAVYSPQDRDWTAGEHTLSIGTHRNEYRLRNPIFETADWRSGDGERMQNVFGETALTALYVQDEWRIDSRWSATLGWRYEEWRAQDGGQVAGSSTVTYPSRFDAASSPKLSLVYTLDAYSTLRASAGRGVRFPTVSELFQGTATSSSIIVNEPDLKPERSDAFELTYERTNRWGRIRASLFQDDVRDSIFAQTNVTVTPNVTNVQNVDRVRTRGVETAVYVEDLGVSGLTVEGNITFAESKILSNENFPISVGKRWPRVPKWRGSVQVVWRASDAWMTSLGLRHTGDMYNRLENDDFNRDVYGAVSGFTMLDARLAHTLADQVEIAIGVDNLTNERSYQSHPLQMRTGFVEVRWSFVGGAS